MVKIVTVEPSSFNDFSVVVYLQDEDGELECIAADHGIPDAAMAAQTAATYANRHGAEFRETQTEEGTGT